MEGGLIYRWGGVGGGVFGSAILWSINSYFIIMSDNIIIISFITIIMMMMEDVSKLI